MKETPYELLEDGQKKKLGKNNEAKMTLYNALSRKEYERVFMCKTAKEVWHTLIITHQGISQVKNCKIDLLTQEYEKFSISNEETIDSVYEIERCQRKIPLIHANSLIPAKSDSLPHAHAQNTKTYYKHQDSRIKKAQELKTKTSANSDIKDNSSETKLQGRLLESFQEDAKYEHVGQDTRSQGGKDDQDKQGKDLEISKSKTKSKDNDKGSRSKITQHEGTSLQHNKDQRFKNSTTKQSQQVQGSKIQDLTSGIQRPHIRGDC
ncbi:hypothetical protein Tco_1031598 [Tanacetum coccineum]|uniref:Zf-CCHC domain-containing protein/DUF4219 domain-containing protein/UBN2 domain-containing protein n=1 Tax=Tanacetum coccineum TaxID=301880 RepID=A0ABQ5GBG2_9ASTR